MIDKIVIDSETAVTTNTLAKKFNEVVEAINNQVRLSSPRVQPPGPAQHISYLESMGKRLQSGPCASLRKITEASELTKAIAEALTKFLEAVQTYKESLPVETKATLEV